MKDTITLKELEEFLTKTLKELETKETINTCLKDLEDIEETTEREAQGKTSNYWEQYLADWDKLTRQSLYWKIKNLLNTNNQKPWKH